MLLVLFQYYYLSHFCKIQIINPSFSNSHWESSLRWTCWGRKESGKLCGMIHIGLLDICPSSSLSPASDLIQAMNFFFSNVPLTASLGQIILLNVLFLSSPSLNFKLYTPVTIYIIYYLFFSVQFSHSGMSDSLRPHESQHARPLCPSSIPGVHSDLHPSSQWCHPAISSSVVPFSSCPQSLPASEYFPMSQLFAWGAQSTGVSALASFPPKKPQGWSPSEWTG